MKLTLIRHTTLDIGTSICYGNSDVGVSANFHKERLILQKKLNKFKFDTIYTSPLNRCHMLAKALCEDENLDLLDRRVKMDERLKELNFGDWEMSPWNKIPRELFDTWAEDYANIAPPNGEKFSQLHERAREFVDDVNVHSQGKNLLVVTHGGLIRALVAEVLNMPLKHLFRINIDHVSLTQLEFDGQWPKVNFMNL